MSQTTLVLRSTDEKKRPNPLTLQDGQLAANIGTEEPGLYFADTEGNLRKVGPCHVGPEPPNSGVSAPYFSGLCLGELWYDTTEQSLNIWNGFSWNSIQRDPPPGATGVSGPIGATGAVGATGASGVGVVGATGAVGATGVGITGATGVVGAIGATGPIGVTGPTGPVGETGLIGASGATGVGTTGATGAVGATGAGTTGATGVGAAGATGASGVSGKTILSGSGSPGLALGVVGDFYIDTANSNFYGPKTESTWGTFVSLVGPVGPTGPQATEDSPTTLTYAATVNLDMGVLAGKMATLVLAGPVTFTTSNLEAGREVSIRIICDSTSREFTFPSWIFTQSPATGPSTIAAGKTAILSVRFWGTSNADATAVYTVQG